MSTGINAVSRDESASTAERPRGTTSGTARAKASGSMTRSGGTSASGSIWT